MIDSKDIKAAVEEAIAGTSLFLVSATVSADNQICVELDTIQGSVSIDDCVAVSRAIEARFNRDEEDYELEVGSAGLTSPFKVPQQYVKNVGNEVEVLTRAGQKLKGTLDAVADDSFTILVQKKVKPEGAKRPVLVTEPQSFRFDDVKQTKYLIDFK